MDKIDEIKLRTHQLASAYKVSNLQDFINKAYRIANKEYIEDLLIKINNKDVKNYIFVVDSNLNINHAIDSIYKELNKEFEIKELEDLSNNLSYKLEDTEYILELYNKYKDDYPFIFKMNNLGSFSNFINHDTLGYKIGVDGQDGTTIFSSNTGTSSASPMTLANDYTQEIKQKKLELKRIQEEDNLMDFNR